MVVELKKKAGANDSPPKRGQPKKKGDDSILLKLV
jgi:hypothetical protein